MLTRIDPAVIAAAEAAQRGWRVPASVSIGQFALESGWGKDMPVGSFNPFGIKALPGQPSVLARTREFVAGRYVTINAPFRKFDSLLEAFAEHARLLATAPVYAAAMAALPDVEAFVTAMAEHYATDPHYAPDLMAVINDDGLKAYDAVVTAA